MKTLLSVKQNCDLLIEENYYHNYYLPNWQYPIQRLKLVEMNKQSHVHKMRKKLLNKLTMEYKLLILTQTPLKVAFKILVNEFLTDSEF